MDLHVTLQGKQYKMTYTDEFMTQMLNESENFKNIMRDLEQGQEKLVSFPVGEEFFYMGSKSSYQGILHEDEIHLVTLIPNRNVI